MPNHEKHHRTPQHARNLKHYSQTFRHTSLIVRDVSVVDTLHVRCLAITGISLLALTSKHYHHQLQISSPPHNHHTKISLTLTRDPKLPHAAPHS